MRLQQTLYRGRRALKNCFNHSNRPQRTMFNIKRNEGIEKITMERYVLQPDCLHLYQMEIFYFGDNSYK